MENIKGSLRNNLNSIIKIKIRNNNGQPEHRAEFRMNDKASWIRELRLLKERFGVNHFKLQGEAKTMEKEQVLREIEEEKENLRDLDWRERTKGLREPDPELTEKMKRI